MNPVRRSTIDVLAIGLTAAALILWLSGSFWLDAWNQRSEAQRLQRMLQIEETLTMLMRELGEEHRYATASAVAMLAEDAERQVTFAVALADRRRLIDTRLDDVFESVRTILATPGIVAHLRDMPQVIEASLDAVAARRTSLGDVIARLADIAGTEPAESLERSSVITAAALAIAEANGRLLGDLRGLQRGVLLEPYRALPLLAGLQRARTRLRDFAEAASTQVALAALAASQPDASNRSILTTALARSREQLTTASAGLSAQARERVVDEHLVSQLRSLGDELSSQSPTPAIDARAEDALQLRVARLDRYIGDSLQEATSRMAAHGVRRLVIDTLLIGICFTIVFASLKLLARVRHQAWTDRLTELPNRFRFEQQLADMLAKDHYSRGVAVLMIDIDEFKSVNDRFGHAAGDELIRRLAARLAACLDRPGLLAGVGADEFALALENVSTVDGALETAERLRSACDDPFEISDTSLSITLSIGVSLNGGNMKNAPAVLQSAAIAMRQAKDAGKNRVQFYSHELAERNRERLELEVDLRGGILQGQLELHYQPKVDTRSGCVGGVEALARWRHPARGLVPPGVFIPVAEQSGLIVAIGAQVLDEAVQQTARWRRAGQCDLKVAVNVSAAQLVEPGFVRSVGESLRVHDLPACRLELEVTESVGMLDMAMVVDRLERLRETGVSIAIDDFGTDYSSLQYLEDLPLDTLKIDRAFVRKLDHSEKGRSLVNTIVLMARSFGLETVAEGVETAEQLDKVIALGCDHVQGYFHSKPVPAEALPDVVARIDAAALPGTRAAA